MFQVKRRATALLLAALMATSGSGAVGMAADYSASGSLDSGAVWELGDTQVTGSLHAAPAEADLEQEGPLGWIHFSDKTLENCPQKDGDNGITNVELSGTLAQIAGDTATDFRYTDAPEGNTKGQVINGTGGRVSFNVPASTEPRYLRVYTGSWASEITLRVSINGEEQYTRSFGKRNTTSGADCYVSWITYQTESEEDEVTVTAEITDVYDSSGSGNMSIQAIALTDEAFPEEEQLVTGQVLDAPETANLTKQGGIDWVQLDQTDFGAFNRKDTEDPMIGGPTLIGTQDYVATNTQTNFVFLDGISPIQSVEDDNHKGLVFTGEGNGLEFTLPASKEERYVNIYTGAWAADITAEVYVNDERVYAETYGSADTTAGTPADYKMLQLSYSCADEGDEVRVRMVVSRAYDSQWGNMSVSAITLNDALVEDTGSVAAGKVSTAPVSADLTSEGNIDWAYFNNASFADYNRKNVEESQITNVTPVGEQQSSPVIRDAKTAYVYTDGVDPETEEGAHNGFVFVKEGSGVTFNVPGGPDLKYLNVYTGEWASDITLELLVNGEVEYSATYGNSVTTAGTPAVCNVARLQYYTPSEDDEVEVRVLISHGYDVNWGNMSIQAVTLSDTAPVSLDEKITTDEWEIDHTGGQIQSMKTLIDGEMYTIPMRTDDRGGFVWKYNGRQIAMTSGDPAEDGSITYTGRSRSSNEDLTFTLRYSVDEQKQLVVTASVTNNKDTEQPVDKLSLNLGFNTYLESYPQYNDQLFPTLLRCEKTHLWGYLSTPSGRLMTIATDAPVASYTLDYEWGAHRIYTASLDVLQSGELPERHPEGMDHLAANETKTWNVYLKPVENLNAIDEVKPTISNNTMLPTIDADRYTMAENEVSQVTIYSQSPLKDGVVTIVDEDGNETPLAVTDNGDNTYSCTFEAEGKAEGVYKLWAENEAGYKSEGMFTIRMPWSWYTKMARKAAVEAPQKATSHTESWYGLYSAYIAKRYFPDEELDMAIDEKFEEIYPLMYDVTTDLPTSWQSRIQNHSGMLGVFVDKYQSSGNMSDLESAVHLADFLLTTQGESGGYYNGSTDYTSVIYPAKSIMELIYVEKDLMNDESLSEEDRATWAERYERHFASVTRAMDNLVSLDGHFETEGQQTFEDGANSCSATQLSEFALMFPEGSAEREKYTNAALKIMNYHTSHQQSIIPDSRMNGGTLRFWEAQYDVEMQLTSDSPNMMNSPHGWSAWNIYALFNLYELTGDQQYLERGMNAMGSCAQLMGFDGTLRWAFIADPYRNTGLWVKDEEASHDDVIVGKHVNTVIGEEYVDMISYWWRAPKNTWVPGYTAMGGAVTQGAACDNDVHEVFKALGEVALTKAYVFQKDDGAYEAYNCTVEETDGGLVITPAEDVVSNVSVQVNQDTNVTVKFYNGDLSTTVSAGLPQWVSTEENAADFENGDKDSSLSSLTVSNGELSPSFQADVLEYTVDIGAQAGTVDITPTANSEHAVVYVNGTRVLPGESYTVTMDSAMQEKTIPIVVKSQYQATETNYTVTVSTMGDYENVARKASNVTATRIQGPATNPMSLIDGHHGLDGSTTTHLTVAPDGTPDNFITLSWDEPQSFEKVLVWTFYGTQQGPIRWDYQVSRDHGQTWETVAEDVTAEWQYSDKTQESHEVSFEEPLTGVTDLRMVLKEGLHAWGNTCINEIEAFGKKAEEPQEKNLTATYNNKDVTLTVNGEPQKIADLLGKFEMKDVADGTEVELTFAPRVEGKNFRSVTINGGEPQLISGDTYTYTATVENGSIALDFVFEVTDKRILEETYNYAKTYVDDGTVDSLVTAAKEAFMEAYDAAAAVLADGAATQAQIDAAWSGLLNVIHYLDFQAGDASALEELYNLLSGLVEDDFTSDSWAAFAGAMAQAAEVIADGEPLEADVTKAYDGLLNAAEGLVRASDRSSLNDLIEKAEEVAAEIAEGKYLPDGQEAFQAALDAAKALTKDDAQATIDAAAQTLTEAMAALRKKADKSELEALLNELEALDASDYTATSYAAVAASIANLKTLLADETLDAEEGQAVVDNAVAQARAAKANLVEVNNSGSNSGSSAGSTSANVGNAYGAAGVVSAGQSVAANAYVVSDTTVNFTLKHGQAYCFKMTVVNGNAMTPGFTVGNGDVLKTQYVAKIGNDYYYRVYAIGTPGQSTGVYTTLPGNAAVKHCTVTIG